MQPNQWQQQQFGYTGGAPQGYQGYGQQQQQPAFLTTQATGFPGAAQPQRPMATGYAPQQQFSAQPTGASLGLPGAGGAGGNYAFLSAPPPAGSFGARGSLSAPSGLAPQMTGFPGGGASGLLPQQTGYPGAGSGLLSQPTGMGGGLLAQPTGYAGLRAQPTGLPHDPRLQAMMQTFMPSNLSQPYSSAGVPQFNQAQQQPLQQTFQTLLQNPAANTPKIPWVLTRQEKKDYDQIFRAWDTKGEGFISGGMAQEVFGQAGLGQEDLMKIWNLADGDNRGKLNLPEFHVAMGLIYRALNGNPIPDVLPEELKPASMKDIDSTVNFMKDLLKHESNTRSDNNSPVYGNASAGGAAGSKDAKVYKHDDQATGTYRSSSRHLDRKAVRYAGEESGAEISDLRRQLQNASDNLDASSKEQSRKTEEDEEIEAEIDDVSRRVRRINEDLEYVSKGRRTQDKDEEKRKLERELLFLMHEKLPELERRQQRREEERRMEERAGVRARDRRNDTHGRYGGSGSGRDDERGDWLRGSYDRDNRGDRSRDRSRDRYDYDRRGSQSRDHDRYDRERDKRDRDRDYDRDYDRRRGGDDDRRRGSYEHDRDRRDRDVHDLAKPRAPPSPPKTASPAPEAPKAAPPPAAKAAPKPAAKPWAKMSAEERAAEARRRVAQRQAALGIAPAEDASAADDTVEERLARERKEAEEKAKAADKEQEAREEARRQRLAAVSGGDGAAAAPAAPAPPAPPAAKTPVKKPPPVAPVRKQHAPPPAPSPRAPPPAPAPPVPAVEVEDSEEAELRAAEEARKKRLAERREQLKRQQEEEEEELRREEEELAKRRAERSGKVASPAAADPPLPPFPTSPSAPAHPTGSHNPFHRKTTTDGTTPTTPASGSFNPFFRPGQAAGGAAPAAPAQRSAEPPKAPEPAPAVFVPPPPPPPPPAPPAPARVNSAPPPDDDWDVIQEKQQEDSDSSDDEYANSRHKRGALASALFGNILPSSKPASRSNSADPEATSPSTAKAAPAAALSKLGGGSAGGGGMSALLSSIQGGARLRHTETVDRSAPVGAGGVVGGDAAPPAHINAGAPVAPPSPPAAPHADVDEDDFEARNAKRQSTDWYGALAADSSHPAAQQMEHLSLEPTREEDERAVESPVGGAPDHAGAAAPSSDGPSLDDVDLGTFLRVRTLYNYETSFDGDLPFPENIVLAANPAKDPHGPWWYATLPNGKAGWIPGSFVEQFTTTPARAVYDYAAGGAEELSLTEGDALEVIDQADPDWWKVEKSGAVYIVPAAYVEIIDSQAQTSGAGQPPGTSIPRIATPPLEEAVPTAPQEEPFKATNGQHDPMAQFPPLSVITSTIDEADSAPATATAPALSAKHLATPTSSSLGLPSRSRTASVSQYSVDEDGGESSDEDSVLSYWSSDDESDHEEIVDRKAKQAAEVEKAKKEEEKKRREQERQKALAAAGLKIRSEAPGIPVDAQRKAAATRRRRPAPAVPQRDKKPSASPSAADKDLPQMTLATTPDIQVQDAYARYEQFLSDATAKPSAAPTPRPTSIVVSSRPTSMVEASSPAPSTASRSSAFSGFLGRLGVGHTAAQERTTPKISGPIVSGPILGGPIGAPLTPSSLASSLTPASEAPEPASDFGKTWGSLVDPSVLSTMTTQERKRQESIFEFIATESSYVRDLQLIVGVFYAKLMTILDDKSLTVIFANVEDILMFNSGFLSSLDDRQKACRLYVDTIGDILADNLINLDVYRPYCVNQDTAAKLLQQLRKQDARLEATLMDIKVNNPSVRGLDLSSFLLQPMQRLTRYPLLLKQIAHYTQPDQDLEAVQRALASTERTVARINEDVREAESLDRLRVLSEDLWVGGEGRIDLTEPTAFQGPRKLIKEGSVAKAKSGRKLTMVLCTDVVILIEAGHLYRMPIPLFDVDVRNGRDDVSFALGVGSDVIRLKAPSNKERIEWIAMLSKARRDAVDARRDAGGAVPASSVRSRSDSVQPRDSREQRRQSNYGGYDEQRRQSNYGGYDEQRRPTSGYGFDDAPAPRLSYDAPAQPAPPRRPVSGYEYRAELDKHTPAPPPRPDYVQSYPGQRVYDDAHTYAGRGENMYNHEF